MVYRGGGGGINLEGHVYIHLSPHITSHHFPFPLIFRFQTPHLNPRYFPSPLSPPLPLSIPSNTPFNPPPHHNKPSQPQPHPLKPQYLNPITQQPPTHLHQIHPIQRRFNSHLQTNTFKENNAGLSESQARKKTKPSLTSRPFQIVRAPLRFPIGIGFFTSFFFSFFFSCALDMWH